MTRRLLKKGLKTWAKIEYIHKTVNVKELAVTLIEAVLKKHRKLIAKFHYHKIKCMKNFCESK